MRVGISGRPLLLVFNQLQIQAKHEHDVDIFNAGLPEYIVISYTLLWPVLQRECASPCKALILAHKVYLEAVP
jgi:hypothetical protein